MMECERCKAWRHVGELTTIYLSSERVVYVCRLCINMVMSRELSKED
jgi:hypothetical protein